MFPCCMKLSAWQLRDMMEPSRWSTNEREKENLTNSALKRPCNTAVSFNIDLDDAGKAVSTLDSPTLYDYSFPGIIFPFITFVLCICATYQSQCTLFSTICSVLWTLRRETSFPVTIYRNQHWEQRLLDLFSEGPMDCSKLKQPGDICLWGVYYFALNHFQIRQDIPNEKRNTGLRLVLHDRLNLTFRNWQILGDIYECSASESARENR